MNERTRTTDLLLGKMWKTKSARFNAHARLIQKRNLSTWATSILAFYIFAGSLVPLVYPHLLSAGAEQLVSILTVIISVFLIIITLLESSKNYDREAERMLQCALEISNIYNSYQALTTEKADEQRGQFTNEYSAALNKSGLNHQDIDFLQFQLRNSRELQIRAARYAADVVKYFLLWVAEYWLYVVLVVIPPLAAGLLHKQLGF
ncbi:SLATT domain-containing protein [Bradyrhizobium japonicum]|uniref:SLATT domain-containing protein n=1 Tax=Bradyrhizobium japonicum TaxID=375 RepID=UPI0012BD1FED|nr:SLATT domain-containing protein [Bradyrhizobium japonicum]WLB87702.1 SLATT domain-containing protein [Bradyrhizobium japonicum USDA 135]